MPGPLPSPNARRRNAPTISGSELPPEGRDGPIPGVPDAYELRSPGLAWWSWAWSLPQAAKWDVGSVYVVARRASLEDDLAALDEVGEFDFEALLDESIEDGAASARLRFIIGRLKGLAAGRTSVMKEMRELDNRLGLNPKAMADLRWQIGVAEEATRPKPKLADVRRIRAVDPAA
jgi:hypothetical protein